jgi:hypothetical protein
MENKLFPKIKLKDGSIAYGGNQAWYSSKAAAAGGCGSVAAANSLASLAASHSDIARKLGISPGRDGIFPESAFQAFMDNLYLHIGSGFFFIRPFGIGIARYVRSVLSYASRRSICLKSHVYITTFASYNRPIRFICRGLKENGAVALLASWNSYTASFAYPNGVAKAKIKNHFITITGIKRVSSGDYTLTVSTWGKKGTISYRDIYESWQGVRAFGTALVYFTPDGSISSARHDILAAPFSILGSIISVFLSGIRK